jgi:hypothetical protein
MSYDELGIRGVMHICPTNEGWKSSYCPEAMNEEGGRCCRSQDHAIQQ